MDDLETSSNFHPSGDSYYDERFSNFEAVSSELKHSKQTNVQNEIDKEKVLPGPSSSNPSARSSRKSVPALGPFFGFPGIGPGKITIGVELEMILLNMPARTKSYDFIGAALKPLAKALDTYCLPPLNPIKGAITKSRYFQVKGDCAIFPDNILDVPVEVATPVLRNNDWNWVIPRMCSAITTAVGKLGATLAFNYSTGLHIHIAVDGRAYTLPEVKRIAKAILLFEKYMDELHPKCRNLTGGFIDSNRSYGPLKDLSDVDALAKIDEARDFNSFICIVNGRVRMDADRYRPSRCFRYNFLSLNLYGTIEFRQAMGTVCAGDILDWIKIVIRFITSAVRTPDYLFTEWAQEGIPPVVSCVYAVPRLPRDKKTVALGKKGKHMKHTPMKRFC